MYVRARVCVFASCLYRCWYTVSRLFWVFSDIRTACMPSFMFRESGCALDGDKSIYFQIQLSSKNKKKGYICKFIYVCTAIERR